MGHTGNLRPCRLPELTGRRVDRLFVTRNIARPRWPSSFASLVLVVNSFKRSNAGHHRLRGTDRPPSLESASSRVAGYRTRKTRERRRPATSLVRGLRLSPIVTKKLRCRSSPLIVKNSLLPDSDLVNTPQTPHFATSSALTFPTTYYYEYYIDTIILLV